MPADDVPEEPRNTLPYSQPIPDSARARLYLSVLDDAVDRVLEAFTTEQLRWNRRASIDTEPVLVEWTDESGHYAAAVNHRERSVDAALDLTGSRVETVSMERGAVVAWKL